MNSKKPSNNRTIVIVVVVIAVIAGIWYFYEKGGSSSSSSSDLSASSPGGSSGSVGANVLSILNSVSSIKIDTSFFSSAAYQSLVDYSITVPPQPVGRTNPFAPTGQ